MKIEVKDKESAIEYLENVIVCWEKFGEGHKPFIKALKIILLDKKENATFMDGYNKGKKEIINKIKDFVEEESKFVADKHSDMLLNRIIKEIKRYE